VKPRICSIIEFTMVAERRNSPFTARPSTSSRISCDRSPLATAEMVRVVSAVGQTRSSISVLSAASMAPQEPERRSAVMRWRVRPSLPTSWPARSISRARRWLVDAISLTASAILPDRPVRSPGNRTEKSPSRMPCSTFSSRRRSRSSSSRPACDAVRDERRLILPAASIKDSRDRAGGSPSAPIAHWFFTIPCSLAAV
jgi:hypothetical protein